jgi:hypothetical protein
LICKPALYAADAYGMVAFWVEFKLEVLVEVAAGVADWADGFDGSWIPFCLEATLVSYVLSYYNESSG